MSFLFSDSFWVIAAAPLICAVLTRALIAPALRHGLVDQPGGRKKHGVAAPLVGGLAIFLTIMLVAVLMQQIPGNSKSLLAAMLTIIVIGVADDAHELGHRAKFVAQAIAALVVVSGTMVHVESFGDILGFGPVVLDKWSYMVTAIAIVGLMNTMNMIDGLDGLAGTQALLPVLVLSFVAFGDNRAQQGVELLILAGAIVGFLFYNLRTPWRSRALVFMGDTGGMLLGLLLAWYSVQLGGSLDPVINPITAVWILAVPLFDMGSVMLLRVMQYKSPFHADRQHLHYVLVDGGYSVGQVVAILSGFSLICALFALQAEGIGVPEFVMFYGFLGLWAIYLAALARPERIRWFASRLILPRGVDDVTPNDR